VVVTVSKPLKDEGLEDRVLARLRSAGEGVYKTPSLLG
jgi:hypothetical protein